MSRELTDLTGKRVLVTGASSGVGAHVSEVLACAGAHVFLAARRMKRLQDLVDKLKSKGMEAEALELDVLDSASVRESIARCGPLDIVINNAGLGLAKPALEQTEADWDQVMDTNLKGAWLVATESARGMKQRGNGGSIVNVASILGLRQGGHVSPYAISKAGLIQMTKQLGLELARFNIRVNAIAPGYLATELNDSFLAGDAGAALVRRIPQRRLGQLEDLDGVILLLSSDYSRYITGAVIPVDGGHLLSTL